MIAKNLKDEQQDLIIEAATIYFNRDILVSDSIEWFQKKISDEVIAIAKTYDDYVLRKILQTLGFDSRSRFDEPEEDE
tara:strand:- start:106 stop:339 length:234 start_codon:yes stop_codon:yes gene_type:complete